MIHIGKHGAVHIFDFFLNFLDDTCHEAEHKILTALFCNNKVLFVQSEIYFCRLFLFDHSNAVAERRRDMTSHCDVTDISIDNRLTLTVTMII